ncbi:glutamate ABC transporter permease [Paucilactobacillus oligofermentans DSM 15707 = LMG 22743]|uniref:Glutamate ABC transporter permease n=1 Tax=Paucilactobacillus oligofermentans DSM 15707 = LMG 22743 TaxID=1423778 RepID=A0A0R1RMB9_9LACO|nr:amino acid ABC transporter permease [Paucilactobacillus oligofermentans]KRL55253.1 glutamate ABC transporter permease [Paucilactobacillus oligofermentans DSM 15707 = LMG 22743]CUS25757.1 Glutamate ABC transporter permease protein [Paucilactobacillus oligofermentans DSM 15707 = LMG 22743]
MFDFLGHYYPVFLDGTALTIIISIIGVLIGIALGLLIVLLRLSKVKLFQWIAKIYVAIVRGTPSMIQVMLTYYVLSKVLPIPQVEFLGSGLDRIIPGSIALGINSGAYVSEIFRSGIISVHRGQTEAGMSLGMNNNQTMFSIVLPQAIRNILPSLGNEFITLIKESSVLFYIGVQEVTAQALGVGGTLYDFVPPLIVAAVIYFVLTGIMSLGMSYVEKHMGNKYIRSTS